MKRILKGMCKKSFLREESMGENMWVKRICKKNIWVKSVWCKVCARRVSGLRVWVKSI